MRPTAFIIVLYILFLLTQPCKDVLGAAPISSGEVTVGQSSEDQDCNDSDDECSPFCICSCRQAPAGYFSFESATESKLVIAPARSTEIDYTCHVSVASLDSIWQPPKH